MDKVDQLDDIKKLQLEIANAAGLQRYLEQANLTFRESRQRVNTLFFESLKREVSSRLAVLEAFFTTCNEFEETDNVMECLKFLNDESQEIQAFIESFGDDEKGGMEDA